MKGVNVPTSLGDATQRPRSRSQRNIDTLSLELTSHMQRAIVSKIFVPRRADMESSRVAIYSISGANTVTSIVQA